MTAGQPTLAEICVVACAEAWRGDGATVASPMGVIPTLGARLAQLTFEPELLLTDGEATLLAPSAEGERVTEGWLPFRQVFTVLAAGKRHVMMGPSQIDRFGNVNISAIGDFARPARQLIGMRGAPGNTVNHPTSYWVPRHQPRTFVPKVDVISGVGYDSAAAAGPAASRFHELRRVVTNLAVLDFRSPGHAMRLVSVHPGISVADVIAGTGFELAIPGDVPPTRMPTAEELRLIRDVIDPRGLRHQEVP